MKLFESICETITQALGLSAFSIWSHEGLSQHPLPISVTQGVALPTSNGPPLPVETALSAGPGKPAAKLPKGPVFSPPNSSPGFQCDYSAMEGWRHTAAAGSRTNWLEKTGSDYDPTAGIYNIFTDYEHFTPKGITREVRALPICKTMLMSAILVLIFFTVPSQRHRPCYQC